MTAGQRIQKCRKAKKLSQEYVATVLGVSRQAVSKWENDLSVPDTLNYINLAKIFGVSVEYLALGTEESSVSAMNFTQSDNASPKEIAAEESDNVEERKSDFALFIGMLLFVIGLTVIVFSLLLFESLVLFLVGVLAIVLAKKVVWD